MNYQDRISIEPGKRGGKPCVRGIRITVYDVLEYLASGMPEQEIIDDFPDLTQEDIRAYLAEEHRYPRTCQVSTVEALGRGPFPLHPHPGGGEFANAVDRCAL
jgi:uncharacterized protein (DUF433 family)